VEIKKKEHVNDYWARRLHSSTDGMELRESKKVSASSRWIDYGSLGVPGREFIQNIHIHINAIPSRMRTSRGRRVNDEMVKCRAGCNVTETTAHTIQGCFRTHGGRIKRHNAIVKTISNELKQKGFEVKTEPHFHLDEGLKKPDILAIKDGRANVIDVQVVSGAGLLNEAHERKVKKYERKDLKEKIRTEYNVDEEKIKVTSCTVSWRGIWSSRSASDLRGLGIKTGGLSGITTRALQGSHINWNRFNRMTTMSYRRERDREGVG
jgi:hypothetical protein